MICASLYKQEIKTVYKIALIFVLILALYTSVMITMFDPKMGDIFKQLSASMPELMAMFGMASVASTLADFLANYLYGLIMLMFPMISTVVIANSLVAKQVESGSMAYLLAAPHSRKTVIFTKFSVLLSCFVGQLLLCTILGILISEVMFPGELDITGYLLLNLGVIILHFSIAGLCFFASCISNDSKYCLMIGLGVPLISLLIKMLANMGGKLENLKYASFFTLFDPSAILAREGSAFLGLVILFLAGLSFVIVGSLAFCKRDLPI